MKTYKLIVALLLLCSVCNAQVKTIAIDTAFKDPAFDQFRSMTSFDGKLIMTAVTTKDTSLWYYTGSGQIKGIATDTTYVRPNYAVSLYRSMPFPVINNKLYFTTTTSNLNGRSAIYQWDGNTHPQALLNLPTGMDSGNIERMYAYDNKLYFIADSTAKAKSLWSYNPANNIFTALTSPIQNISNLYLHNNKFYFLSNDISGISYFNEYDPVNLSHQKHLLTTTILGEEMVFLNGNIFVKGEIQPGDVELFVFDKTLGGFKLVRDLIPGSQGALKNSYLIDYKKKIYFFAADTTKPVAVDKKTLYTYDPQTDSFSRIYSASRYPIIISVQKNNLFIHQFTAYTLDSITDTLIRVLSPYFPNEVVTMYPSLGTFKGSIYFSGVIQGYPRGLFKIVDSSTSIKNIHTNMDITLYPNPAQNELHIKYSLDQPMNITVNIVDINGRKQNEVEEKMYHQGSGTIDVNLKDLPPGTYFATVHNKEKLLGVYKFLKE